MERRPGQTLERHDLAEESTRQANLEAGMLRASPNHGTLRLPNDDDDYKDPPSVCMSVCECACMASAYDPKTQSVLKDKRHLLWTCFRLIQMIVT